jgi:hypothetical protein
MKIKEIAAILEAVLWCGATWVDCDVHSVCGADLMSDVLAFVKDQPVLLTGLMNSQVIRTADMMDIKCIVFIRGKKPEPALVNLAVENSIVLMTTDLSMYAACGKLYTSGLR